MLDAVSLSRVSLRPTIVDRLGVCVLLLFAVSCVGFAVLSLRTLPPATVQADGHGMAGRAQHELAGARSRAAYDATYTPAKSSPLMMLAFAAFLGWLGVRWWRGWYSTIDLDWATRTVTIERRPVLFGGAPQLRFAASELRLGAGLERAIARGRRALAARIELRDRSGKRVFTYTAVYDNRWRKRQNEQLQQLVSFFAQSS